MTSGRWVALALSQGHTSTGLRCPGHLGKRDRRTHSRALRAGAAPRLRAVEGDHSTNGARSAEENRNAHDPAPAQVWPRLLRRRTAFLPTRAGEILILGVEAIRLARCSAREPHRPSLKILHAGDREPDRGDIRIPAACARMGIAVWSSDESTAGVPRDTPMSGGRDFIGWSLLSDPTRSARTGHSLRSLRSRSADADVPAHAGRPCGTSPRSTRGARRTRGSPSAERPERR